MSLNCCGTRPDSDLEGHYRCGTASESHRTSEPTSRQSIADRGTLNPMSCKRTQRLLGVGPLVLLLFVLTACDGYIEEVRVQRDGSAEFVAQATVVCTDPLQREIWGGDPCEEIDAAIRTGEIGALPFDFALDPNRVSLVGTGDDDRRTIDVFWEGTIDEVSTVLVSSGSITVLDDLRTEAVFTPADAPDELLRDSPDPGIVDERRTSRWDPAEFRILAPDLVVEHNGDDIQGRLVIWQLDDDRPDEFRIVWSTEDPPRRWWWWALGTILLTGVLIMMITIEGPAQSRAAQAKRARKGDSD